jgi:hypothetical protein
MKFLNVIKKGVFIMMISYILEAICIFLRVKLLGRSETRGKF